MPRANTRKEKETNPNPETASPEFLVLSVSIKEKVGSDQTMSDDLQGSHSTLNRKGLFGKWRSRYISKSVGRPSPNMTPVSSPARNCSTPR